MLGKITYLFLQNQESYNLLQEIGLKNVVISGDTRFDRVYAIASHAQVFPIIQKFAGQQKLLLAGSTWPPDENIVKRFISENQNVKLIIAPHEVHNERIRSILTLFDPKNTIRYSDADDKSIASAQVLIIDQIGILSSLYQYCDIAYIGGGFGHGIHNILEAVTFGKPVIFGPNYQKFKEAVDLLDLGGAFTISNETDLNSEFSRLTESDEDYNAISSICKTFIEQNRGATDQILNKLSEYIDD